MNRNVDKQESDLSHKRSQSERYLLGLPSNNSTSFKLPELHLSSVKHLPDLTSPSFNIFDRDNIFGMASTRHRKKEDSRVEPVAVIEPNKNMESSMSPNKSQALLKSRKKIVKNSEQKLKIKTIRPSKPKEAHAKNVIKSIITSSVTKIKPMQKCMSPYLMNDLNENAHNTSASQLNMTQPQTQSKSVSQLPALNFLKSSTNEIIKKSFEVNASISQLRQSITKS